MLDDGQSIRYAATDEHRKLSRGHISERQTEIPQHFVLNQGFESELQELLVLRPMSLFPTMKAFHHSRYKYMSGFVSQ